MLRSYVRAIASRWIMRKVFKGSPKCKDIATLGWAPEGICPLLEAAGGGQGMGVRGLGGSRRRGGRAVCIPPRKGF